MIAYMKRRLFVAILLPEEAVRQVRYALDRIDQRIFLFIRVVPEKQWHITLKFLGECGESEIPPVRAALESMRGSAPVRIVLDRISYDTDGFAPRMLWAKGTGETSRLLGEMRGKFDTLLKEKGVPRNSDFETFSAHVTLARFGRRAPRKLPPVNEPLSVSFFVESLELMESFLSREQGARYEVVASQPFG